MVFKRTEEEQKNRKSRRTRKESRIETNLSTSARNGGLHSSVAEKMAMADGNGNGYENEAEGAKWKKGQRTQAVETKRPSDGGDGTTREMVKTQDCKLQEEMAKREGKKKREANQIRRNQKSHSQKRQSQKRQSPTEKAVTADARSISHME